MAEDTNQQKQQPQQQGKCPGNCSLCNMYQRNYCASQISYTNMKILTAMLQEVNGIMTEVKAMKAELAASHQETVDLINPTTEEE